MQALVIDDDPSTQKIMKLLLEKSGYEPMIFSDGQTGCSAALSSEAPSLIIVDWMLPDVDGLAVCRKLRAANLKTRPYIVFLTSKKERSDAVAGLDAGADDFISKPFNVAELQARLRVAQRTIEYQRDLVKRTEELEAHVQRTQLRGERSEKLNTQEESFLPATTAAVMFPAASVKIEMRPTDFSNQEIRYLLSSTLVDMRLVLEAARRRNGAEPLSLKGCDYTAWSGLLLGNDNAWLDIMVGLKAAALAALFERALDRKATGESELRYFLSAIVRAIAMGFMRTLEKRCGGVLHPLMSRTVKVVTGNELPPPPADSKPYDLVIEGQSVQLTLASQDCPVRELAPAALRELDVLAEQFPSKAVSEVPMFLNGVVLTPRFIEKLISHVEASQLGDLVRIHRPSGMAQFFSAAD
jgi:DNA-binding response OmpR family regulator